MTESDLDRWWREKWATAFQMKAVATVDQDTDPSDVYEDDHRVARLEQFGDIVCPPAHELGVLWMGGHGGVGMVLSSPTYKPKTQNANGTCYVGRGLYCEVPGVQVLLHGQNSTTPGKLELNSGTKAGGVQQDVVVNGGTKHVARKTDPVGFLYVTSGPVVIGYDAMGAPIMGVAVTQVVWSPTQIGHGGSTAEIALYITDGALHFLG